MAQLKDGTRIYGNATIDGTLSIGNTFTVGTAVTFSTGGLSISGIMTAARYESSFPNTTNFIAGPQAGLTANATSSNNVLIGYQAGYDLDSSSFNIAVGYQTLYSTSNSSTIGNIAIGNQAMSSATQGDDNIAVGHQAGRLITTGSRNTYVGYQAGLNATSGADNTAIGPYASGFSNLTGLYNINIGYAAGYYNSSGSHNIHLGYFAGGQYNTSSFSYSICIGRSAGAFVNNSNNIFIGAFAASVQVISGSPNTAVGYAALQYLTSGSNNCAYGFFSLGSGNSFTGSQNSAFGDQSGYLMTSGSYNVAMGVNALFGVTTGSYNTCLGWQAGRSMSSNASFNTFVGSNAGGSRASTNTYNIGIGVDTMAYDASGSVYNIGMGRNALLGVNNTSTGSYNIAIGNYAGQAYTSGSGNLLLGQEAGDSITIGSNNVVIVGGSSATIDVPSATGSNQLVIGSQGTAWIYGDSSYNIGIGTHVTSAKLTVNGTASFSGNVSANAFVGDGSGLVNLVSAGASGIIIRDDGSLIGVASTIDFGTGLTVSPIFAGIVTVTSSGGGGGGSTVGIATTGVSFFTDISATGIITARHLNHFEVLSGTTNVIQSVIGGDLRFNDNNASWSTTHPGGAGSGNTLIYCDDAANNATNRELLIRLGLGHWNPLQSQGSLNSIGFAANRMLLTGRDNSIGAGGDIAGYNRNYHYAPIISHILPIRNNSSSNINVNVAWSRSSQYGDYNGSMMMLVTPTNSSGTRYSTVNGTTVTVLNTTGRYALDSVNVTGTQTGVTIAAGKTCLLVQISTARPLTTNAMTFKNMFNDVTTLFTNADIQCDLRMVSTLVNANWYAMGWTSATADLYKVWNICSTLHGDR